MEDKEIAALTTMNNALKNLDEDERFRVMQFMYSKYAPTLERSSSSVIAQEPKLLQEDGFDNTIAAASPSTTFSTFAEMLDASNAKTEPHRFLVAAYWLLESEGQESFKSSDITKLLKDTGNQISRVSNAIRPLKDSKPACIVQLTKSASKSGKGRVSLKLTTHGIKEVEDILSVQSE